MSKKALFYEIVVRYICNHQKPHAKTVIKTFNNPGHEEEKAKDKEQSL